MHMCHIRIHLFFFYIFHLFQILLLVHSVSSLNCYVCNAEDEVNTCDNFKFTTKNLFTKECPRESQSCFTQIEGNLITIMACEEPQMNDCKNANGIKYCYCDTNLCNGNMSIKPSISTPVITISDDEDLTEGSGSKATIAISDTTVSITENNIQSLNTGECLHSTFIIIASLLLLP